VHAALKRQYIAAGGDIQVAGGRPVARF